MTYPGTGTQLRIESLKQHGNTRCISLIPALGRRISVSPLSRGEGVVDGGAGQGRGGGTGHTERMEIQGLITEYLLKEK